MTNIEVVVWFLVVQWLDIPYVPVHLWWFRLASPYTVETLFVYENDKCKGRTHYFCPLQCILRAVKRRYSGYRFKLIILENIYTLLFTSPKNTVNNVSLFRAQKMKDEWHTRWFVRRLSTCFSQHAAQTSLQTNLTASNVSANRCRSRHNLLWN